MLVKATNGRSQVVWFNPNLVTQVLPYAKRSGVCIVVFAMDNRLVLKMAPEEAARLIDNELR